MANTVYLSPYQAGYINGIDHGLSLITEMFIGRPSNTEATFYACVFQAGVSRLIVSDSMLKVLPDNAFVKDKTKVIDRDATDADYRLISEMFSHYLPEDYWRDEKFQDVCTLESLLSDLCIGLRQNASILFPGPLPEPESFRGVLPPELLLPASRLLSAISTSATGGPLPRYEIQKADVKLYEAIVHSGLFNELSKAHVQLRDQAIAPSAALSRVRRLAAIIQEKYADDLRLTRLGVSLLSLVPKFVEKTIGLFPGKIAEHIAKLAKPFLENRKRIVIYDSSHINREIILNTMLYVAKNRDKDSVVNKRLEQYKREHPGMFPKEADSRQ